MINSHSVHPLNRYISQVLPCMSNQSTPPPRRTRISRACDHCQLKKTKCDSMKPRCSQCIKRNDPCTFTTRVCKRGPKPKFRNYLNQWSRESQVTKSNNIFPYFNILLASNSQKYGGYNVNKESVNRANCTNFCRSNCHPLHQAHFQKYNFNNRGLNCNFKSDSSYLTPLKNLEFQTLPPIQLSQPSPLKQQNFEYYKSESLMLPSLSRNNNDYLPSISALLRGESESRIRSYSRPTTLSSQTALKITPQDRYKPVNNELYYRNNNKPPNANLKVLY